MGQLLDAVETPKKKVDWGWIILVSVTALVMLGITLGMAIPDIKTAISSSSPPTAPAPNSSIPTPAPGPSAPAPTVEIAGGPLPAPAPFTSVDGCQKTECIVFVHFNDVHDRVEMADASFSACDLAKGPCYGGFSRFATVINNATQQAIAEGCRPIILDAGDTFTGTLWDTVYKGIDSSVYYNHIGVQAMAVGNHEFDFTEEGLLKFAQNLTFPLLSSNTNFTSAFPELQELIKPYTVVDLGGGVLVGVIGVTTKETPSVAKPDKRVMFADEATSAQKYIDELKAQGVQLIVILSHAGYDEDLKIAEKLTGAELIIGAHTHTFLFDNTTEPLPVLSVAADGMAKTDKPAGSYPTLVSKANSTKALIVQAMWGTRYVGVLKTQVCMDNGTILSYSGAPRLVTHTVTPDPLIEKFITQYGEPIQAAFNQVMGETTVDLIRNYSGESNLGNMVCDAFIWGLQYHTQALAANPNQAYMAFYNSGGLRSDIPAGNLTYGNIKTVLPFGNVGVVQNVSGAVIRNAIEMTYQNETKAGFLQASGLRWGFDKSQPRLQRVINIMATNTPSGQPELLLDTNYYMVVNTNFLAEGGDGFGFEQAGYVTDDLWPRGVEDATIVMEYVKMMKQVWPALIGRIVDCGEPGNALDVLCATAL